MFLITFDIIDSKTMTENLKQLFTENELCELSEMFEIGNDNIWIHDHDQISIIYEDSERLLKLVLAVLLKLKKTNLQARVYIGKSKQLLYRNNLDMIKYNLQQLEDRSKRRYKYKFNSIYYSGFEQSPIINLLFVSVSNLCLSKVNYLDALYLTIYEQKKQAEIAKVVNLSQAAIVNQLRKSNAKLFIEFDQKLTKLLELDT